MSISAVNPSVRASLTPAAKQTASKPPTQVVTPKDSDGDTDGDTGAKAASEKKGGVDVKG